MDNTEKTIEEFYAPVDAEPIDTLLRSTQNALRGILALRAAGISELTTRAHLRIVADRILEVLNDQEAE